MEQQGYLANETPKTKKELKKIEEELGHNKLFGALVPYVIWDILSEELFENEWWAIMVKVILSIGLVIAVITFIGRFKDSFDFTYKTKPTDLIGLLIALVVLNSLLAVFNGAWWMLIPVTVVGLVFAKTLFEVIVNFINDNKRRRQDQANIGQAPGHAPGHAPINQGYKSTISVGSTPIVQINNPTYNPGHLYQAQPAPIQPQKIICPVCGFDVEPNIRFCPACGSNLS